MLKKVALAALTAALLSSGAEAATQTGTFTVSATFNPSCTLDTTSASYNFGQIGATTANLRNNGNFSFMKINCSTGTPYTVTLASANSSGGPVATGFNMINGAALMSYRLYPGASSNNAWDATGASTDANGTGNGADQFVYIVGEIPVQAPAAGSWATGAYTDTVTATITY